MGLRSTSCCGMCELNDFPYDEESYFDTHFDYVKTTRLNIKKEIQVFIEDAIEGDKALIIATTVNDQKRAANALKMAGFTRSQRSAKRKSYQLGDNMITLWTLALNKGKR